MTIVPITSQDLDAVEVSWFSALCSDDFEYLGVPEATLRSSWAHCSAIVKEAETQGFRNILCPSSYQVGQDTLSFVAGCAPITEKINMLAAVRCGEMQPIMLARTIATLDHMLQGRLTVNIGTAAQEKLLKFSNSVGPKIRSSIRARSINFLILPPIRQNPIRVVGHFCILAGIPRMH